MDIIRLIIVSLTGNRGRSQMKKDSVFTQSTGMCFGLIYGVTVGTATHNIGLWLPIGLCLTAEE